MTRDHLIEAQRLRIYTAGAQALCRARNGIRWQDYLQEARALYAATHAMEIVENNIKRELQQAAFDDLMASTESKP